MGRGGGKRADCKDAEKGYETIRDECVRVTSNYAHFRSILYGVQLFVRYFQVILTVWLVREKNKVVFLFLPKRFRFFHKTISQWLIQWRAHSGTILGLKTCCNILLYADNRSEESSSLLPNCPRWHGSRRSTLPGERKDCGVSVHLPFNAQYYAWLMRKYWSSVREIGEKLFLKYPINGWCLSKTMIHSSHKTIPFVSDTKRNRF